MLTTLPPLDLETLPKALSCSKTPSLWPNNSVNIDSATSSKSSFVRRFWDGRKSSPLYSGLLLFASNTSMFFPLNPRRTKLSESATL